MRTLLVLQVLLLLGVPAHGQDAHDQCSNAILLPTNIAVSGSTIDAAIPRSGTATCGGVNPSSGGRWYAFVGDGSKVKVTTCFEDFPDRTSFDTVLVVFRGSCGRLTCVGRNDDDLNDSCELKSAIEVDTVPGELYYILVHGLGSSTGEFDLVLISDNERIDNDRCQTAEALLPGLVASGSTETAATDTVVCGETTTARGLWYAFLGDGNSYAITTCPNLPSQTNLDTVLSVFRGTCSSLTCIDSDDDFFGAAPSAGTCRYKSGLLISTVAGELYYVWIAGYSDAAGPFDIDLRMTETLTRPSPRPTPGLAPSPTSRPSPSPTPRPTPTPSPRPTPRPTPTPSPPRPIPRPPPSPTRNPPPSPMLPQPTRNISPTSEDSSVHAAAIVVPVALVVLILAAILLWCCRRKGEAQKTNHQEVVLDPTSSTEKPHEDVLGLSRLSSSSHHEEEFDRPVDSDVEGMGAEVDPMEDLGAFDDEDNIPSRSSTGKPPVDVLGLSRLSSNSHHEEEYDRPVESDIEGMSLEIDPMEDLRASDDEENIQDAPNGDRNFAVLEEPSSELSLPVAQAIPVLMRNEGSVTGLQHPRKPTRRVITTNPNGTLFITDESQNEAGEMVVLEYTVSPDQRSRSHHFDGTPHEDDLDDVSC